MPEPQALKRCRRRHASRASPARACVRVTHTMCYQQEHNLTILAVWDHCPSSAKTKELIGIGGPGASPLAGCPQVLPFPKRFWDSALGSKRMSERMETHRLDC